MRAVYVEKPHSFEVKDMPVTVAVDSTGDSAHKTGPAIWEAKIAEQTLKLK